MAELEIIDQMGRQVLLASPPKRIISIVPSQTELIHYFDSSKLIARTHFCVHPSSINEIISIGGTKKLQLDKIKSLEPDLIIGNKEENEKSQIEELEKHFPVWMSDISNLEDSYAMMLSIGQIMQKEALAADLVKKLKQSFSRIEQKANRFSNQSVLYFIWRNPWMLAGKKTFIDYVLKLVGFNPICQEERYPELKEFAYSPDLLFLSSEPYPFKEDHFAELAALFPEAQSILVDGEVFSWYGNRLLHLESYLDELAQKIKKPTI